jgi:uncharacterized protein (DUF1810 family)
MDDPHDLARFVSAQAAVYDQALAELRAGRKRSHWMWFVFPQLAGLGHSAMAQRYGIASRVEAEAYLTHKLLGARLRECTAAVLLHPHEPPEAIFGEVDALKFRSSMTLFDAAGGDRLFAQVLDTFYAGERDRRTLKLLD